MPFNDYDDSNDRPIYRNYARRIEQREDEGAIEAKLVIMGNTGKWNRCSPEVAIMHACLAQHQNSNL
jgi:hypothetical protein